jgi:hypothetical protein
MKYTELIRFEYLKSLSVYYEILTAVKIYVVVFWIIKQCVQVSCYLRYGGIHCLHTA